MWPGLFALLGTVLLGVAAFGFPTGRVSLALLAAAFLAAALFWSPLTVLGG